MDVETTGIDFTTDQLICFAYYSPTDSGVLTDLKTIVDWIVNHQNDSFGGQNFKFDQKVILKRCGHWLKNDFDTLLAASLLPDKPRDLNLEALAQNYLGEQPFKLGIGDILKSLRKQHGLKEGNEQDAILLLQIIRSDKKLFEEIQTYCLEDCRITYQLCRPLSDKLVAANQFDFYRTSLMPFANLIAEVEFRGYGVDTQRIEQGQIQTIAQIENYKKTLYETYFEEVKDLELEKLKKYIRAPSDKTIRDKIHFNWGSRDQKLWLLKDKLGFPCVDYRGNESIKKEVLEEYSGQHPIVESLLSLEDLIGKEEAYERYRSASHNNRIHTNFSLTLRNSGRLSSSDPPLQNVDKDPEMRSLFVAAPGKILVVADFSKIEPALMAHFSQDPSLLWAFHNNIDYYMLVTAKLLGLSEIPPKSDPRRTWGKVMGLAIPYGMGLKKMGRDIEKQTGEKCDYRRTLQLKDIYWQSFPLIQELVKSSYREVQENGYVETLFGRRQYTSKHDSENKPINRKIQTSASDLACFSQLWVLQESRNYNLPAELVHLVHDEVIYEAAPEDAENFGKLLDAVMCHGYKKYSKIQLTIPLGTEIFIGRDWSCKH